MNKQNSDKSEETSVGLDDFYWTIHKLDKTEVDDNDEKNFSSQYFFENFIPSNLYFADLQQFPRFWSQLFTASYMILLLGSFIVLFVLAYRSDINQQFISLDINAGRCNEVPAVISGTFSSDTNGYWNTQSKYTPTLNNYFIVTDGISIVTSQYQAIMESIQSNIQSLSGKCASRDFGYNLIAWLTYSFNADLSAGSFKFYTSGDPAIAFDKPIAANGIIGVDGICLLPYFSNPSFSFASYSRALTYSIDMNTTSDSINYTCPSVDSHGIVGSNSIYCSNPCYQSFSPALLLSSPSTLSSTKVEFQINMLSASLAIAINYGIVDINTLIEVEYDNNRVNLFTRMQTNINNNLFPDLTPSEFQTFVNHTSSYFDPQYDSLDLIYCTTIPNIKPFCFIVIGSMLAYPVINGAGFYQNSTKSFIKCNSENYLDSKVSCAKQFNINLGFIYYAPQNDACISNYFYKDFNVNTYNQSFNYYGYYNLKESSPRSCTDNGYIFLYAKNAAEKLTNNIVDGDLFVANNSYDAMNYALLQPKSNYSNANITEDGFLYYSKRINDSVNSLCAGNAVPKGCAMLVINYFDSTNTVISPTYYQPQNQNGYFAFSSAIFNAVTFNAIINNPPVDLVQAYYKCYLKSESAFFAALSSAIVNAQTFTVIFLSLLAYIYLKRNSDVLTKKRVAMQHAINRQRTKALSQNLVVDSNNFLKIKKRPKYLDHAFDAESGDLKSLEISVNAPWITKEDNLRRL